MISPESGIIITGASRGIGASTAEYLARVRKNPLLLIGRNHVRLEQVADVCRIHGCTIYTMPVDLTDEEELNRTSLPGNFNPSVLINNAGVYIEKNLEETQIQDYYEQFRSNVITAVAATRRFLPDLLTNTPALIVNICSIASLAGIERSPAYAVSKHALLGYTRSLRQSLAGQDVAATAINLGPTASGSWDEEDRDTETLIDPVDVARLIDTLLNLSTRGIIDEILFTSSSK
ncbi:MAG: SDR family NAD(P)-dependent oxidoreductase [Cyclonatronaceae bacterium]